MFFSGRVFRLASPRSLGFNLKKLNYQVVGGRHFQKCKVSKKSTSLGPSLRKLLENVFHQNKGVHKAEEDMGCRKQEPVSRNGAEGSPGMMGWWLCSRRPGQQAVQLRAGGSYSRRIVPRKDERVRLSSVFEGIKRWKTFSPESSGLK